ncbi:hypothetical protein [Micromonospora sp. WMMD987]|jgi:malonyl CoA-acyl carrier protein transacylase|uniref:hypothetical protein n=1 Tax=Micromonospora TaxID=1873 RepID=UPI00249BDBD7|nr:hypothetical protein [Micromonospora sp. WMMD987]WFE97624.1 hypothetical protein O7612_12435 [Micromonospora sp. WMMD987]
MLLFDGLGGANDGLLPALRGLYTIPANATYFSAAFRVLDEAAAYLEPVDRVRLCPDGTTLRQWLTAATAPPDGIPRGSVTAGLCIHLYQACQLQPIRRRPDDAVAALGHSIGLLAAVLAGLGVRRTDDYLEVTAACLRLAAVTLVRGQQYAEGPTPDRDAVDRFRARVRRSAAPGPMAALTGLRREEIDELLTESDGTTVTVSLTNAARAHVLSGPTVELLDFYFRHETRFARTGATWAFLNNTIPFHSPRLLPAVRGIAGDRDFVGHLPGGDRLRLPVYATDAPRDLRDAPDLVDEFCQQVLSRPVEWEHVTRHAVTDSAIDRIVDHGPGAGARRFTKECLRDHPRRVVFESAQQFSTPPGSGGQRAMSALSGPGRATPGNGIGPVRPVPGDHRAGG